MTPTENLAALRDGRRYSRRDEQPVQLKLDTGLSLELPGPRLLASTFALPWLTGRYDVYKSGREILTRPKGTDSEPTVIDQAAAAHELRTALMKLPDRRDAGRPYRDLRLFTTEAEAPTIAAYLGDTLAAVRKMDTVTRWRPPASKAPSVKAPVMSAAEQKAAQRARIRAAEVTSSRWWLDSLLDEPDDELGTGTRVTAAVLYELAADTLADLIDDGELLDDSDPGSVPRIPGPRIFYAVADEALGPRHRSTNGAQTYTIPPAFNTARTRSLMQRREFARALQLQRAHYNQAREDQCPD